jgi:biopolymer transport protein ExbD
MLEKPVKLGRREINLIPMVNVIFLLLTFFMVAGTIEKIDPFIVDLPNSHKKGAVKPQRIAVVYMHKDGRIAVNDDFVSRKDFSTIVNTILLENKGKEIVIKADSGVLSGDLIWVMRVVENVGGSDISIVTKVAK